MIKLFGVIANDKLNRYNEILTIDAMVNAYLSQWRDIFPMTVNHDRTRLIGFSKLFSIFMEPGATHLTNQSIMPESDNEKTQLENKFSKIIARNLYEDNKEDYEKLLGFLKEHLSANRKFIYSDSIAIIDEGIVPKLFPELWDKRDNDGLIQLSELDCVMPGIFLYKSYLVYAHPYFRRSLSRTNSLNIPFLKRLQELTPNAKIALDPDMIGLAGTQSDMREYAYWWGPKFNDDLGEIPTGVTRFENENYNTLMSPILRTECGWYIQDDTRTFECEEITDVKNIYCSNDSYGCRYVHSMLSSSNVPRHLDGAIRAYDDEKMLQRSGQNMNQSARNTTYTKLWRVDGEIQVHIWKELITHFYRDNPLIGEYFCEEKYSESLKDHSETRSECSEEPASTRKLDNFIPISIDEGSGIRVQITISERETLSPDYDVYIRPLDYLINNSTMKAIEYESITLAKALAKNSLKVRLPFCNYLAFNDLVINFPFLVCNSIDQGNIIFNSLMEFCRIWSTEHDNRIISFAVKINYSSCAITYSMIGHVNDFVEVFNGANCGFAETIDDLSAWCKTLRKRIDKFPIANQTPAISRLNNRNSILHYSRTCVPEKHISGIQTDDSGMSIELILQKDILKTLTDNHITASSIHTVKSSICNSCGKQYETCDCIKFLDPDCTNTFDNLEYLGSFWTTQQA